MKFRKHLSASIDSIFPSWRDKFLSYKYLKKQLKRSYPYPNVDGRPPKRQRLEDGLSVIDDNSPPEKEAAVVLVEKEVNYFMELLDQEIDKFNDFFLDKEEDYVIKMKILQDRVAEKEDTPLELVEVGRQILEFQGEMILLEYYSTLNCTGLAKILKKYDKRSGALIRRPYIHKVVHQPFFRTDVLNNLMRECERMVDQCHGPESGQGP